MRQRRDEHGLDDIDRQILMVLQADCKTSLAKIGERVGLSPPSVVERVKKLETEGFIHGYHAQLDARRLGIDVTAFIGVWLSRPRTPDFEAYIASHDDVLECHHVTGGPSLLLKVKTRNTQTLEELIGSLRQHQGVERTETNVVLSTMVEKPGLGDALLASVPHDVEAASSPAGPPRARV
ncbi:MAG: Lrp/AsnC family transcriptional regulator [Myxococcales bacterium]|nr:Lrp/AsnC family transcriptional regulator [Myxococcales bacterium]MDD9966283.1 Lrp/AsnC family transcriptional regulator [Myxococcales bacterium]